MEISLSLFKYTLQNKEKSADILAVFASRKSKFNRIYKSELVFIPLIILNTSLR